MTPAPTARTPHGHLTEPPQDPQPPKTRAHETGRPPGRQSRSPAAPEPALQDDKALTRRQKQILAFIKASTQHRGYPPSLREIGTAVGLSSTSGVQHHVKILVKKGLLKRDPNRPRTYQIVGLPPRKWTRVRVAMRQA